MISRILTYAGLAAVRIYKITISPYHPPVCRFMPTCSTYAEAALKRYGFLKGTYLSLRRVLRCHPFSPGGYDPLH